MSEQDGAGDATDALDLFHSINFGFESRISVDVLVDHFLQDEGLLIEEDDHLLDQRPKSIIGGLETIALRGALIDQLLAAVEERA